MPRPDDVKVLLVYPKFHPHSFWNYRATCEAVGAKYPAPPLGLITVAALLPREWNMRLVNCNTEELTQVDLDWADLVMTGGMLPQQRDCLRVIREARRRGKAVVVGGPDATSSPHVYEEADFKVLGEAEEILADFVAAWSAGASQGTFKAQRSPDLTRSPVPRYDLLKFDQYLHVGVQFCRGCPFNCEFCDIIELYGRVPRVKTDEQMLRELDTLYALGYRGHIDFVDDNLIGSKKRVKEFLPKLRSWLERHDYPFEFSTEASINLADDDALLAQMRDSNFFAVFVGIETPDGDTLVSIQKRQNARRSIVESIEKIHRHGIFVNVGFIIGFDAEKGTVAREMIACIEQIAVPACMVGLLYALPNTQLSRRLLKEGRLHPDDDRATEEDADQCTSGLNFRTARPRREVLDDYRQVVAAVYEPASYFARVRRMGRLLDCRAHKLKVPLKNAVRDARAFLRVARTLGFSNAPTRVEFWRTLADTALTNPLALKHVVSLSALYLHFGPFAQFIGERLQGQIGDIEAGRWREPEPRAPAATPSTASEKDRVRLTA